MVLRPCLYTTSICTCQGDARVCSWMQCNMNLSYMGTTFALRQSEGTSPVSSEVLKIKVRIGEFL